MNLVQQVEECFGKGAVRATRVRHAVSTSTCMDWCTVVFTIIIMIFIAAGVEWVAEQITHLKELTARAVAGIALLGVPVGIVLWAMKVREFPVNFL